MDRFGLDGKIINVVGVTACYTVGLNAYHPESGVYSLVRSIVSGITQDVPICHFSFW